MKLIEHFYRMIAPSSCVGCQTEGSLLCLWCREDHLRSEAARCYKCNRLSAWSRTCSPCRRSSPLKHVFVRTEYTGTAKELIHKMKFSYSGEAADLIAEELVNTLPDLPPATIVVHIPTITSHVRERGYDHARRMARGLARQTYLRHVPALSRLGQHRQVGSKRTERLSSVNGAFRTSMPAFVQGATVLLVDDVLTTGATLEAAARELKRAGAKSVSAVVFARAR